MQPEATKRPRPPPLAYLLTFTCYGTWLHGDSRGSVNARENQYQAQQLPSDGHWVAVDRARLVNRAIFLGRPQRLAVRAATERIVRKRGWSLGALSVLSNHVHVVLSANCAPERALISIKAAATAELRARSLIDPTARRIWTRHGSTRYLYDQRNVDSACAYVRAQ